MVLIILLEFNLLHFPEIQSTKQLAIYLENYFIPSDFLENFNILNAVNNFLLFTKKFFIHSNETFIYLPGKLSF